MTLRRVLISVAVVLLLLLFAQWVVSGAFVEFLTNSVAD